MDLLAIIRKLWRYKLLTLPIIVLTICGAAYVVAVQQPVYEAKASYVLFNPPAPPTAEDIARDPKLAKINVDNPYTRFGDQSVVLAVLASTMTGESAHRSLVAAGAEGDYTVAPSTQFGYSSPIMDVTGVGTSAERAMSTAGIVGEAMVRELDRMQRVQGVDERYRIKTLQVDAPDEAQLQASGKLRMLVGVLVLGAVLLFIVVSAIDGFAMLRMETLQRDARARAVAPIEEPWPFRPESDLGEPEAEAVGANGRHARVRPYGHEREGQIGKRKAT